MKLESHLGIAGSLASLVGFFMLFGSLRLAVIITLVLILICYMISGMARLFSQKSFYLRYGLTDIQILSGSGNSAILTRHLLAESNVDNLNSIQVGFRSSGILSSFEAKSGTISHIEKESDRWTVTIRPEQPLSRGQLFLVEITCLISDSYIDSTETFSQNPKPNARPGAVFVLRMRFPESRQPKSWRGYLVKPNSKKIASPGPVLIKTENLPTLFWATAGAELKCECLLEWTW